MPERTSVDRQVERILDERPEEEIEVIVQMDSGRGNLDRLEQAAAVGLHRRRFSQSPRELLPLSYQKRPSKQEKQETASTSTLLGKATAETLALSRIQRMGLQTINPLLQNGIVRAALARMAEPARKGATVTNKVSRFWTSRSMPLRLEPDELRMLTREVENIRAIHVNRRLSLPVLQETRQNPKEVEDLLVSTWGVEKVRALAVWGAYGAWGKGVTIGLLDTGVDPAHPDLKDRIAHWAEFDSLGNLLPDSKPHDSSEHGTHCAGTLVGGKQSGRYIGVAPEAKLAAALVLDGENGGTDAQVLAGIDWAVETKVDVINLSLGGWVLDPETPTTYTEAILSCIAAGIPVVAAIGNEGQQTTGSPGNDQFALSIGATDPQDRAAAFSGGRTMVLRECDYIDPKYLPLLYSKPDLSAPGVAVYSSVPGGGWKAMSGTSMAAPHVAGAIALLLSATQIRKKEAGAHRAFLISDLITGSVEDLGESGQDHRYGFGRLDVLRAVDFARERGY
ncbi:MAG TPA: S8 family serine peptidase [Thermoanaerobaculia bacterium]|nr:S8 family serine peptidase [Thermoanaerobaculia bacterium]